MNTTIARLALAALLGRKRFILLLLFPVALIGLSVLVRVLTSDAEVALGILFGLGLLVILPLLALVSATAVMGPEVDDGSLVYLLAKPVSRHSVAFSKYVVALAAVLLLGPLPMLVTGFAIGSGDQDLVLAGSVSATLGAIAYTSLFLALSTVWKHAVVVGLLFVLLWEGTLAAIFSGVAWLSIGQWAARIGATIDADWADDAVPLWWAVGALFVVGIGGVWFSGDRLRSFSLKGDD
ncbi:ABC transporter permease subunit [Nocardioides gilvus]|uniref:ABC transporter permease subunit n=1 Tax=Nocardioides gilvus TaxID=1735589 RepID=UPI000D744CC7|nr:ABC transporter permease subunit [Nocardioides gilvus]